MGITKYRICKLVLSAAILIQTSGCGKTDKGDTPVTEASLNGQPYFTVGVNDFTKSESQISGTGALVFKNPLRQIKGAVHYSIAFSIQDSGSVTVHSHANEELSGGADVVLSRANKTLSATLSTAGRSTAPSALETIDADGPVSLTIDVHNNETPAHILIWPGTETNPNDDNTLLNSGDGQAAPGTGTANFWGLTLNKASLTIATYGEAKFKHD